MSPSCSSIFFRLVFPICPPYPEKYFNEIGISYRPKPLKHLTSISGIADTTKSLVIHSRRHSEIIPWRYRITLLVSCRLAPISYLLLRSQFLFCPHFGDDPRSLYPTWRMITIIFTLSDLHPTIRENGVAVQ